ncbi:unnamed protein product [Victoria cruziana]
MWRSMAETDRFGGPTASSSVGASSLTARTRSFRILNQIEPSTTRSNAGLFISPQRRSLHRSTSEQRSRVGSEGGRKSKKLICRRSACIIPCVLGKRDACVFKMGEDDGRDAPHLFISYRGGRGRGPSFTSNDVSVFVSYSSDADRDAKFRWFLTGRRGS